MKMKKIFKYLPILFLSLLFTSCLESGLDELPAFSDADITRFRFEHRWLDETNTFAKMQVVQLATDLTIDEGANTINCIVTVPAASANFPEAIRNQVAITNVVGYADISPAAVMEPIGDSPVLGVPGDFGSANQYEVKAADGETVKVWTIIVKEFNK